LQVLYGLLVVGCALAISRIGSAQTQPDTVVTLRKESDQTIKRRGTIVQWKGMSLTIHSSGRDREIDNDDIVEVQTKWSEDYRSGIAELKTGKTQIAIVKLQEALKNESRPWAQRIIRSHLVDAFQSIEKPAAAVDQFLQIVREDPHTRFLHLAPLPWTGSTNSLDQPAQKWIESDEPVQQLIGASWLLGGAQRAKAIEVLQDLSRDIDTGIRNVAIAQLWRVRANVNLKQTQVWQQIIDQMPRSLRAGPCFVLADAQSRAGQVDEAQVNLMRIPILYADQRSLSAAALYRTANLLHNSGQPERAQTILDELVAKYPQTVWAQQVTQ
jgi:tetratricopeptide (TPR) repeat protein